MNYIDDVGAGFRARQHGGHGRAGGVVRVDVDRQVWVLLPEKISPLKTFKNLKRTHLRVNNFFCF
jgi:hypothetical protein